MSGIHGPRVRRFLSAGLLVFAWLAGAACDDGSADCGVADQVKILDTGTGPLADLYLVLRVSGFQEKESFYELYRGKPSFDSCGNADREPLSSELIDEESRYLSGIAVQGSELVLAYTEQREQAVQHDAVRLPHSN